MTCVGLLSVLIIIIFSTISSSAENEKNVCKTPDCHISSEMLKMSMNSTVDPCENFYEYACGNFPSYKKDKYETDDTYNWFIELKTNLTKLVKESLNSENISTTYDLKALEKMHLFHKSCSNRKNMNKVGTRTIEEIMSQLGLQYVGFSNWLTGYKFNWVRGAAKIKKVLGIDFLIMTEVVFDEETNTTRIQISNPNSCTPPFLETRDKNNLVSPDKVFESEDFSKYAMDISEIFLDTYGKSAPILRSKTIGESRIEHMAKFMLKRIEICQKSREMRNILTLFKNDSITSQYKKMSLKLLKEKTETASFAVDDSKLLFDWDIYLSTLFEGIDGVTVDDELELYVEKHTFFHLIELLKETSTMTLALALWFDAFTFMVPFSTTKLRNLDYSVKEDLGMEVTTWEDDTCSPLVQKYFGLVLMHQFVKDPKVSDEKKRVEQMVDDLKHALNEVIGKSEWMDEQTRVEAKNKIDRMRSWISHPPWLSNGTSLDLYYEKYTIKEENFLLTLIGIIQENVKKNLDLYEASIEEFELEGESIPMTVNAFYSPDLNLIIVPFGIIHRPFFGHPLAAMNYGGLGMVIGHEVTHGFDTTGSKYDEKGQQRNWWMKKTFKKYKENTKCFINAYNDITIKLSVDNDFMTMTCDGEKTLNENIADNGGMREVLIAYRKYVSSHSEEPFLVGFENFSHEQLLTLSFANLWCSNSPLAVLAQELITDSQDVHAQNEARVNGVFMNSEEMSQIWKCPKGSRMNPEKKCRIW